MAFVYDSYGLKYSPAITIMGSEKNTTSLELQEAQNLPLQLSGFIYSLALGGAVIANALVSVYDLSDKPVASAYTDDSGYYFITALEAGDYKVVATANRFYPADPARITLETNPLEQDFMLQPNINTDRVIYGVIFGSTGALNGARIDVIDDAGNIIASTFSIDDGEYSVPLLQNGVYSIVISAADYSASKVTDIILSDETPLVGKNVKLTAYVPPVEPATISGYITNKTVAIANAWVGLYRDCEILVASTTTTVDGYYSFSDVAPGCYVVKAKALA